MDKNILLLVLITLTMGCLFSSAALSEQNLINLDVVNQDIQSVLKMLAHQQGYNIVISRNVTGIVTVKLENVTIEQALESILKLNNYIYTVEDGIINVMSYQDLQHEERFAKKQTKVFTLQNADVMDLKRVILSMKTARGKIELNPKNNQIIVNDTPDRIAEIEEAIIALDQPVEVRRYNILYADVEDIQTKLLQIIPKEKGQVFVDGKNNAIVIKATPVVLKHVDELIKGWDFQPKQVLIESQMVKIQLDDNMALGVDWEIKTGGKEGNKFVDLATKLTVAATTGGAGGIFTLGSLTAGEYTATIEALKATKFADILSAPKVVVLDGEEAKILVGSSEPYKVAVTDPVTKLLVEEIKYVDVGIKLIVTPRIGEDNYITMKIHPEVSKGQRVLNDSAVQVIITEADTTMMVRDGETAILGGLIDSESSTEIDKVPLLGDIPLLGLLFRKNVEITKKSELIIFITPHILGDEKRAKISKQEWDNFSEKGKEFDKRIEFERLMKIKMKKSPYEDEDLTPDAKRGTLFEQYNEFDLSGADAESGGVENNSINADIDLSLQPEPSGE
ncbi:MAG: secretin N-terminal domain-containing protein [bacterium]|nr:secretin N-terminal domain-containing protein [bacterium]